MAARKSALGRLLAIVGVVAALAVGAGVVALRGPSSQAGKSLTPRTRHPQSMAAIFAKVSPAVVSVNVDFQIDPNSRAARGRDHPPIGGRSTGSGFFISADGLIVTNSHVVENEGEVSVTLSDGREFPARIVGRDPDTDLAVLKVVTKPGDKTAFSFVEFEDGRAAPRVGDWVIAIGNPFGLGGTATSGIISAEKRTIGEGPVEFIQIDAAINRGNSGGPTFDLEGRVIGVNTAIYSPSGGSVGIGFAVPADVAASVTKQLSLGPPPVRGYLGAAVQTITPETAEQDGLDTPRGALVMEVTPSGPAARAGLEKDDIIVGVADAPVRAGADLTREIAKKKPGDLIRLKILRDGRRRELIVRLGERPKRPARD